MASCPLRALTRVSPQPEGEPPQGTYYADYLHLEQLLDCQNPLSSAHEELLFITVHQSHELWFKLIIKELSRVHELLSAAVFSTADIMSLPTQADLAKVIASLERVKAIQPMLLQKLAVLETMTPMEFLEFRDFLVPASGFQSIQFRIIEILLGLSTKNRGNMSHDLMRKKLRASDYEKMMLWEHKPSLQVLTEKWLERMPWLPNAQRNFCPMAPPVTEEEKEATPRADGRIVRDVSPERFDWTRQYKEAVYQVIDSEEAMVREIFEKQELDQELLEEELRHVASNRATFDSLFDPAQHKEMVARGVREFSQKAILNAVFAHLYRDMNALHSPFRFLTLLVEIDDGFTSWRYRHAQMAHRMIGRKMGTGATSGADHLLRVAQQNSSFKDLRNLSTFLIPTSKMPPLPPTIASLLRHDSNPSN